MNVLIMSVRLFLIIGLISSTFPILRAEVGAATPVEQQNENVLDIRSEQNSNEGYFFALTHQVMASSLPTYVKPFLFIFSFGLDIGMLPFALVGEAINQANEAS